jgi:hypothetical protein
MHLSGVSRETTKEDTAHQEVGETESKELGPMSGMAVSLKTRLGTTFLEETSIFSVLQTECLSTPPKNPYAEALITQYDGVWKMKSWEVVSARCPRDGASAL